MGGDRRARRQQRAQEFGARHPHLTLVIVCALLVGVVAVCCYQLSYGTYLGLGWVVAAVAGMVAAAGFAAAMLIRWRRRRLVTGRLLLAWVVLTLMSASSIRYPFPQGPYGSVQAFFNVVHAALLGYEAVTCTALIALFVCTAVALQLRARGRGQAARAGQGARLPARLRSAVAEQATWRAGHLIAANGTVTWRSLKGDAQVDLTAACQALPVPPAGARGRQPRTTTLGTADGLVELDVSPKAILAARHRDEKDGQVLGGGRRPS